MNSIVIAFAASLIISLFSLLGLLFFKFKKRIGNEEILILVGIAVGALLGDAFLHLIPEAWNNMGEKTGLWVIVGMVLFFILEKIIKWHHCHEPECNQKENIAGVSVFADSLHNLIDGLIIGVSFLTNTTLGISTSIAILMHEIPQEIGDFAILIHSGWPMKKAALVNLLSALMSSVGVLLAVIFKEKLVFMNELLLIAAGGFIYLAGSDLIPELHRHENSSNKIWSQLISLSIGVGIMYFLL